MPYNVYSPVTVFKFDDGSDPMSGYAAGSGDAPCLVKLLADETPVAFARATRYAPTAAVDGFRGGWCGFEIAGAKQAFALSDAVTLRCGVSGEILMTVTSEQAMTPDAEAGMLTVAELLSRARSADLCPSAELLTVFALNHFRRHGLRRLVEATYETLLLRWPDSSAREPNPRLADEEKRIAAYIRDIMKSDEYMKKWGREIPGPFHPAFRYDRSGII